ncbi:hypothetical protein [Arsukibacterium indicum]|uniref:Uncharacterized protein n=1 Tax=Arsukibacterium indicum TaxID=2848612 RepID=A0ABS6MNM6_9GAMM|nr:hypothetical protein [Arsukibacterium indicum]MBV2130140.1 hypothetical protein [Arsukibacterium indicum]
MDLNLVNAPYLPDARAALQRLVQHSSTDVVTDYPLLLAPQLSASLLSANAAAISQAMQQSTLAGVRALLPADVLLGNAPAKPHFFAVDFALCCNQQQQLVPQLIELQAFPSMLAMSFFLEQHYGATVLAGQTLAQRQQLWQQMLQPEQSCDPGDTDGTGEIIMLDYQPLAQRTAMSFVLTARLGVQPLCVSELYRKGRNLFYRLDGRERKVQRIYNRLILAALPQAVAQQARRLLTDADVSWLGHPDWYYSVSKASMLFMQGPWLPPVSLVNSLAPDTMLADRVCKPLFDFAGRGVELSPTAAYLESLPSAAYMLQQKVNYATCVITPQQHQLKTEIRVMSLWPDNTAEPVPVAMMARLTAGVSIGMNQQQTNQHSAGGATVALCAEQAREAQEKVCA